MPLPRRQNFRNVVVKSECHDDHDADKPDLERKGWISRMELNDVIYYEQWDRHRLDSWAQFCSTIEKING